MNPSSLGEFSGPGNNYILDSNVMAPPIAMVNVPTDNFFNVPPEEFPPQIQFNPIDEPGDWKLDTELKPITIDSGDLTMTNLSHQLSSNLSLSDTSNDQLMVSV